jgi:AhpD family alkylhydroperoxidase
MVGALEHVDWESCLVEVRPDGAVEAYARRKQGFAQPMISCFAPVPWVARALVDQHCEFGLLMHLDQELADLIVLAVSQENSCRYCYAGVRALLWLQGMSRARIQRMEHDLARSNLSSRTMAAIAFARSLSRSGVVELRPIQERLERVGFGIDEIKEIAYVAAATEFSNRAHTIPAIPAQSLERMPNQFLAWVLRPILGRIVSKHRRRGQIAPLPVLGASPYASLIGAYAGSPIAPTLIAMMNEMWESQRLTRRCKLLMFAVVARALACETRGSELVEALRNEGLELEAIQLVLTHLDAPPLDPIERLLVAFVRETVYYEPAVIQRRARAIRGHLTVEQFIEAIGVAALANAICRLDRVISLGTQ